MFIKGNLFNFLRRYRALRRADEEVYVWIDAICINQSDEQENSQQVSSMLAFYEHAKEVVVWLGEEIPETLGAMAYMVQDDERRQKDDEMLIPDTSTFLRIATCVLRMVHSPYVRQPKNDGMSALDTNTDFRTGIRDLYRRPWITRVWIKQEIWAAKNITVHCGRHSVSWNACTTFFGKMDGTQRTNEREAPIECQQTWMEEFLGSTYARAWSRLRCPSINDKTIRSRIKQETNTGRNGLKQNILKLLEEARYCESTDRRDIIYALLGICDDPDIKVDYTANVVEVFTSLAKHLIKREARVGVVLGLNCTFGSSNDMHLPSWVPDWLTLDLNARDTEWTMAFDADRLDLSRKRLEMEMEMEMEMEINMPLLPQRFDPLIMHLASPDRHAQVLSEDPLTHYQHGFTVAKFPQDVKHADLHDFRLLWEPLKRPIFSSSTHTNYKRFRKWQKVTKMHAFEVLNHVDPGRRTYECYTNEDSSVYREDTDRERVLQLLGCRPVGPIRYIPERFRGKNISMDQLDRLGDVPFHLSSTREHVRFQAGDSLVICYGCELPVVLRPVEDAGFKFVGLAQCHEVRQPRHEQCSYHDGEPKAASIEEEFRIMLQAREALGGIETFAVV